MIFLKKEAKSKASYFVSVKDHLTIRRTILEALRDILDTLQRFHDFHQKRHEKAHKITQLKGLVNNTNKLIWRLRSGMPEVKLPAIRAPKAPKEAPEEKVVMSPSAPAPRSSERPKTSKPKSDLDALEDELAQIEKKLSKLT